MKKDKPIQTIQEQFKQALKNKLDEGNIWDRNADGSMPTLEDTTARHAMKEASTDDLDQMKSAISKVQGQGEGVVIEAIEDGYYALADNLPNLINDIQKAIKIHAKSLPADMQEIKALRNELKIYNDIRTLLDESTFGSLL